MPWMVLQLTLYKMMVLAVPHSYMKVIPNQVHRLPNDDPVIVIQVFTLGNLDMVDGISRSVNKVLLASHLKRVTVRELFSCLISASPYPLPRPLIDSNLPNSVARTQFCSVTDTDQWTVLPRNTVWPTSAAGCVPGIHQSTWRWWVAPSKSSVGPWKAVAKVKNNSLYVHSDFHMKISDFALFVWVTFQILFVCIHSVLLVISEWFSLVLWSDPSLDLID